MQKKEDFYDSSRGCFNSILLRGHAARNDK